MDGDHGWSMQGGPSVASCMDGPVGPVIARTIHGVTGPAMHVYKTIIWDSSRENFPIVIVL